MRPDCCKVGRAPDPRVWSAATRAISVCALHDPADFAPDGRLADQVLLRATEVRPRQARTCLRKRGVGLCLRLALEQAKKARRPRHQRHMAEQCRFQLVELRTPHRGVYTDAFVVIGRPSVFRLRSGKKWCGEGTRTPDPIITNFVCDSLEGAGLILSMLANRLL